MSESTGVSHPLGKKTLISTNALLGYLALTDFVFHMIFAENYGYFRDELYYIVSGTQHLSLGYVDFPPLIAYVAAILNVTSKDSLLAIRAVPALNEALLVFVAGMMARELGGGARAQLLAAVSTLTSFAFLTFGSLFTPDSFDSVWWSLLALVVIRIVKRREPRLWVAAGLVIGVGLLTKLTILFFVGALLLSFIAIPSTRQYLRSKWIGAACLLPLAFILPMIYWNYVNGWPMVHFYEDFRGDVSGGGPVGFSYTQLALMTFLDVPIFLMGLYFYLRSNQGRQLRPLGLSYILLFAFMIGLNMKPYYLAPAYPMLFAGGAMVIEKSSVSNKGLSRWFGSRPYLAGLVLVAVLLAPVAMPILSPPTVISKYGASDYQISPLPDEYGWSGMVSNLSHAFNALPVSIRTQACIFTSNYGEASAVNFFGKDLGLPKAISGHNNYYVWGPGSCTGHVLITVGEQLSDVQQIQANATLLTTLNCQYCIYYESSLPVFLLVDQNLSISSVWSQLRHYD